VFKKTIGERDFMKNRYVGRNVDLSLLRQWIEQFFKKKNFRTVIEKETNGYRIIARPTHVHEIVDNITVSISGTPNDFTLNFVTGTRSEAFIKLGMLTSLFGGGIAYLRGVKSQEVEEKIEKLFWIYIGEKIDYLANKVKRT
jgi:hypothetical protein